jgi:stage II sporulation protein D
VVGSGGRTRISGPQLRARFGLYDTWATFNVISASGQTTNPASQPDPNAPPADGQTGGVSPGGGGARATWIAPTGVVRGRISGAGGKRIVLQQRERGRWRTVQRGRTSRHGGYVFVHLRAGDYRVRWRGASSARVRL